MLVARRCVVEFPTPRDPDTAERKSSTAAQPAWGYSLASASFGSLVEGNIVSQAMLIDELGVDEGARGHGIDLSTAVNQYQDGRTYSQRDNTIRSNIVYRIGTGLQIQGDWSHARSVVFENNVVVANHAVGNRAEGIAGSKVLSVRKNRFYANDGLPANGKFASGNTTGAYATAAAVEKWPDPNRTLKRYVTEVLGLTLLDWDDDPWLDTAARKARSQAGESYDPAGMKTFMAVATNMRRGGRRPVPSAGNPSWAGDYRWDERLTGPAVVNWIRAGFGLPKAE